MRKVLNWLHGGWRPKHTEKCENEGQGRNMYRTSNRGPFTFPLRSRAAQAYVVCLPQINAADKAQKKKK